MNVITPGTDIARLEALARDHGLELVWVFPDNYEYDGGDIRDTSALRLAVCAGDMIVAGGRKSSHVWTEAELEAYISRIPKKSKERRHEDG